MLNFINYYRLWGLMLISSIKFSNYIYELWFKIITLFKKSLGYISILPRYSSFSFPIFLALWFKIITLLKENLDRPFHVILWFSPKDLTQRILFLTSSTSAEVSHTHSANQSSWCEMPLPSSKFGRLFFHILLPWIGN